MTGHNWTLFNRCVEKSYVLSLRSRPIHLIVHNPFTNRRQIVEETDCPGTQLLLEGDLKFYESPMVGIRRNPFRQSLSGSQRLPNGCVHTDSLVCSHAGEAAAYSKAMA